MIKYFTQPFGRMIKYFTTIWSDDKIFYTTIWLRYKIFAGNSRRWVLNLTEKIQIRIRQRKYRGQSDKEKQDKALGDFIQIIKYSQFKVSGTSCAFQPWEKGLHRLSDCRLYGQRAEKGLYRMKRVLSEQVAVQRLNNSKPDPRG